MARILLVDDEDCIVRTTAILLESEGYTTVCVLSAAEALSQLDAGDFDLMVTDIRMVPVDGMELIRQAKAKRPKMPIIVVSAYCSDKAVSEALESGAFKYVKKPFRIEEVLSTVKAAMASA